jgi:hypothetical protein
MIAAWRAGHWVTEAGRWVTEAGRWATEAGHWATEPGAVPGASRHRPAMISASVGRSWSGVIR